MKLHLLIIDPQKDFCNPHGSLYVTGAEKDMERLARLVDRLQGRIDDIHITLDSHRMVDISHPGWWRDSGGRKPAPYTQITAAEVRAGKWTTTIPAARTRSLAYLEELEVRGRYPHVIWPEHCLIGDEGHNVSSVLAASVHEWEQRRFSMADFVTKGSNPWTEHFSAVQAEVPDPADPTTQVNTGLIHTLEDADVILLAGEALSHCLANTVRDVASHFADPTFVSKMVLLTDASTSVPGFENYGTDFVRELAAMGMKTAETHEFLAA